jgi:hypothetical protein
MTCPSCRGAHTGPLACRKCQGAGVIEPAQPQRQTPPTASERAEFFREYNAALIATRDLHCSCGRSLVEHERPCMSDEIRASEYSMFGEEMGEIISGSLAAPAFGEIRRRLDAGELGPGSNRRRFTPGARDSNGLTWDEMVYARQVVPIPDLLP